MLVRNRLLAGRLSRFRFATMGVFGDAGWMTRKAFQNHCFRTLRERAGLPDVHSEAATGHKVLAARDVGMAVGLPAAEYMGPNAKSTHSARDRHPQVIQA